jgi:ribosomal protein S27AE
MKVKELSIPERVPKLEACLTRIDETHPLREDIRKDLVTCLRGYKGEKAVGYYLDFLSEKENFIFHSLRLPSGKYYFQIDYLILTLCYALILECKNFYGTLYFDGEFNQVIRTAQDREEGFQDPISQAKWHQQQLRNWLESHNISNLPIDYFVVIGSPSTILKTSPHNRTALNKVVHGHSLLEKIRGLERQYQKEVLDLKGMRKVSKALLKEHTPENFDVMKKYKLEEKDILTGVFCPKCGKGTMIRENRSWYCPFCHIRDRNAHIGALQDYFHIMAPTITNRQFREFVQLSSEDTAKRLLSGQNMKTTGTNKGRIYHKPEVWV